MPTAAQKSRKHKKSRLKVLDLFSGIGGFSFGLERTGGFSTAAFCEIEEYPRRVLAKHWPEVPQYHDVRKLTADTLASDGIGHIDVITGGYPCQPFSAAGRRRGAEDDRHLWPEFNRLVAELRPAWVIGENVAGHISMGLDDVLSDLEEQGYATRTFVIPACAVGAPHRRDRVWVVAHSNSERWAALRGECQNVAKQGFVGRSDRDGSVSHAERQIPVFETGQNSRNVAHADNAGLQGRAKAGYAGSIGQGCNQQPKRCGDDTGQARNIKPTMGGVADGLPAGLDEPGRWPAEPDIGRTATGVKDRAARLKALGNAVVPQIPEMIGHAILASMQESETA